MTQLREPGTTDKVMVKFAEGTSPKEIAETLGIPEADVVGIVRIALASTAADIIDEAWYVWEHEATTGNAETIREIIIMVSTGAGNDHIAAQTGIPRHEITQTLYKLEATLTARILAMQDGVDHGINVAEVLALHTAQTQTGEIVKRVEMTYKDIKALTGSIDEAAQKRIAAEQTENAITKAKRKTRVPAPERAWQGGGDESEAVGRRNKQMPRIYS